MDQSQRGTATDHSNNLVAMSSSQMPHVLFREIHKNAFLKRHSPDRRAGFPRKSERVWVVFCVHDDVEAFLEIYPDQKVALTHKPEWFVSLANALHVSPSICGHEDEFEFAVTLSTQVIRLTAPTWEAMMEWVDTIRNKLRELKILSPKENLYSKMPEQKQPLLPTRDPNSPLPLPPDGPSTLLPGVEPVHLDSRINVATSESSDFPRQQRDGFNRNNLNHERRTALRQEATNETSLQFERETSQNNEVSTISHHPLNQNTNVENNICSKSENDMISNRSRISLHRAVSIPESSATQRTHSASIPTCSNITVIEVSCPSKRNSHSASECSNSDYVDYNIQEEQDVDDVFVMPPITPKLIVNNSCESTSVNSGAHYEHVFLPNPVVTVESTVLLNPSDPNTLHSNEVNSPLPVVESECNVIGITKNGESSSHKENLTCSSSVNISNDNCHKKTVVVNLPSVSSVSDYKTGAGKKFEENCCISQQIQSKLEKVPVPGLIPRVPAKSSKHEIAKKNHQGAAKSSINVNVNANETGKSTADVVNLLGQQTSELADVKSSHSEEIGSNASIPLPAYSQAAKLSKGKIKGEGSSTSQDQRLPNRIAAADGMEQPVNNERTDLNSNVHKSQCKADGKQATIGNEMASRKTKHGNINRNEIFLNSGDKNQAIPNNKYRTESNMPIPSTSGVIWNESSTRMSYGKREGSNQNNTSDVEPLTATVQPSVGVISVEDIPLIGGHQRRRRRSSSSEATTSSSSNITRSIGGADRIRINVPVTQLGREPHREEGEGRCLDVRNEAEQNSHVNFVSKSSARLTLREQQVLQLRREIMHSGGVRLQLRRKECVGSIALVDVLNGVWVAGWKQREHPMLYNALHIGDQLISVSDVVVRSAADAQKIIRTSSNIYIELIIRRVPFGRVFALHRSSEGQNLGIVQEGNTAEIKDVLPNSIAAHAGLSAKTPSVDGLSLTTWFLTEVNGRPLNLFFKDNEVRDRLNSVGKDISILVQPHDLIKQIKKNLKNIRSYKEYIVQ